MAATAAQYDAIAQEYDAARAGARWRAYDEATMRGARDVLPPPGADVLDAGAGTGVFAIRFLERGDRVTLLDPSPGMLEKARRNLDAKGAAGRARFLVGGIERIPVADASFDLVFCEGDPLSYCLDARHQAARELLRVLRPGGGFYVSCDGRWLAALAFATSGRLDEAEACLATGRALDPYGAPVHAFAPGELRALFEEAGAVDVRVRGKLPLASHLTDAAFATLAADPARLARFLALDEAASEADALATLAPHLQATGRKPHAGGGWP